MSSQDKDPETIRVVKFDGTEEDQWREWSAKTRAIAMIKGWEKHLHVEPDPLIDLKNPAGKEEELVVKRENDVMMYLTLACSGLAFEYIIGKSTAFEMYSALKERFEPEEIDDYLELSDRFMKCDLENEMDDPEKWFHKLEHLRVRMKNISPDYEKKDQEMQAYILSKLPKGYSEVVTSEMKTLQVSSLRSVEKEILKFYRRKFKDKKEVEVLSIERTKKIRKRYKGLCKCCGFQGHKREDCYHKEKKCNVCNKIGHLAKVCKGEKSNIEAEEADETVEFIGVTRLQEKVTEWLGDTGATVHVTDEKSDLQNAKSCDHIVKVGGGEALNAKEKGSVSITIDGKKIWLKNVLYVPNFKKKIISIGKLLNEGAIITGDKEKYEVKSGNIAMPFWGANELKYLKKIIKKNEEVQVVEKAMDINEAHKLLGHIDVVQVRNTAKMMGFELNGKMIACEGCCQAKAKTKPIHKTTQNVSTKPGERLFVDTSGPFPPSWRGKKYWIKTVDDYSRYSWSEYVQSKDEMLEAMKARMKNIQNQGHQIKSIRMDNAGENIHALKRHCENVENIKVELTPPHAPQYNGVVERRFATDKGRAMAMVVSTKLKQAMKHLLWEEAVRTAEMIGNVTTSSRNTEKSPYEIYHYSIPNLVLHTITEENLHHFVLSKNPFWSTSPHLLYVLELLASPEYHTTIHK